MIRMLFKIKWIHKKKTVLKILSNKIQIKINQMIMRLKIIKIMFVMKAPSKKRVNLRKIQKMILEKDFIKPLILRGKLMNKALKNNKMKMTLNRRNKI